MRYINHQKSVKLDTYLICAQSVEKNDYLRFLYGEGDNVTRESYVKEQTEIPVTLALFVSCETYVKPPF